MKIYPHIIIHILAKIDNPVNFFLSKYIYEHCYLEFKNININTVRKLFNYSLYNFDFLYINFIPHLIINHKNHYPFLKELFIDNIGNYFTENFNDNDNITIIKKLLENKNIDPSINNNQLLIDITQPYMFDCDYHKQILKMLIKDSRTDISTKNGKILINLCRHSHISYTYHNNRCKFMDLIKLLLNNEKIKIILSKNNKLLSKMLYYACICECIDLVKLILSYPNVDIRNFGKFNNYGSPIIELVELTYFNSKNLSENDILLYNLIQDYEDNKYC